MALLIAALLLVFAEDDEFEVVELDESAFAGGANTPGVAVGV
jgi:hypothetical protein